MPRVVPRVPWTLPLLPGLRYAGKLRIERVYENGDALVAFDAEIVGAVEGDARYVYDRTVLTPAQLEAWTGESVHRLFGVHGGQRKLP